MEFNKKIKEIIQDEIKNFSLDQLRGKNKPSKPEGKSDYDKIKEIEDIDNAIFHGGDSPVKKNSNQKFIKENEESGNQNEDPRITQTEIDQFEKDFREKVSPLVNFSKKEDGSINFELYKVDSGVEAKVSGTIPLKAENKIDWSYSLQNGAYINVSAELTSEVSEIINKMSFFYEEWKKNWVEKLTELPGTEEEAIE